MKKILLIDDDPIVITILKQKIELNIENVDVDTACDFGAAIILASSKAYGLIIIDNILSYPGEGDDLARQIAMFPLNELAPLWIISGDFNSVFEKDGILYMPKPTDQAKDDEFKKRLKIWEKNG